MAERLADTIRFYLAAPRLTSDDSTSIHIGFGHCSRQSPNGGYISTCVLFWPEACISPSFLGVTIVAILYLGGGLKPAAFLLF